MADTVEGVRQEIAEIEEEIKQVKGRIKQLDLLPKDDPDRQELVALRQVEVELRKEKNLRLAEGTSFQRRLPTIDENQEAMGVLAQRVARVEALLSSRKSLSASWTRIKEELIRTANVQELVQVDVAAKAAAADWLQRAQDAGVPVVAAMSPMSWLPEVGGTQTVLTQLLKHQPKDGRSQLYDTHNRTSVCGRYKPDTVGSVSEALLPSSVTIIVDAKSQTSTYNSADNVQQIYVYCWEVLDQLPATSRASVLAALTDLKRIQFLRVTRTASGYEHTVSPQMDNVLEALSAVLLADPSKYDAKPPPRLQYQGADLSIQALLGVGATAFVYKVTHPHDGNASAVAKVPVDLRFRSTMQHERDVLAALQQAGCCGVPEILGLLDHDKGLLMKPVGAVLGSDALAKYPRLFEMVGQLVDTLEGAHALGWCHCDIRLDNLLVADGNTLLVSDWGFARQSNGAPLHVTAYSGTVRTASDAVLEALANEGSMVPATASDDLASLVKCMFLVTHAHEASMLKGTTREDLAALRQAWEQALDGRPEWIQLMEAAAACDYEAVKRGLISRLQ